MARPHNHIIAQELIMSEEYTDKLLYVIDSKSFFLYQSEMGFYLHLAHDLVYASTLAKISTAYHNVNITIPFLKDIIALMGLLAKRRITTLNTPYIALQDKLLNTETFGYEDFDINKVATSRINVSTTQLEGGINAPNFFNYLNTTIVQRDLSPDKELQSVIQEMFGYYLMNSLETPAVFFLVGSGSNGKSVLLKVLKELIGSEFCCAKTIQTLTTDKWATAGLIGKKLNICSEEESRHLRSDKFKCLVSGEPTEGERKNQDPFTFEPTTKFIFASNNMPSFEGIGPALKRRMKIIPFNRVFQDSEQDKKLLPKLLEELPSILKWAIEGGKRFQENGGNFSKSSATDESMEEFTNSNSSGLSFFSETYVVDKDGFEPKAKIYNEYVAWCGANGRKPFSLQNLTKELTANTPELQEIRQASSRGWNIRKKTEAEDQLTFGHTENKAIFKDTLDDVTF